LENKKIDQIGIKPNEFGKIPKPQMVFKFPERNLGKGDLIRIDKFRKAAKTQENLFGVVTEKY
jgi:hypothetical protein